MTEILQHSDFILKVSFTDIQDGPTELKSFKFSYTTPLSKAVVAEFDGQNYSQNCTPTSDGVMIKFDKPCFNVGQLSVHRKYSIVSQYFDDKTRDIVQYEELPIKIVRQYSKSNATQKLEMKSAPINGIVIIDTLVVEVVKGDKGIDGTPAMDYSILTEQIVPGEFAIDLNGEKKQVYCRTFCLQKSVTSDLVAQGFLPSEAKAVIHYFGYLTFSNNPILIHPLITPSASTIILIDSSKNAIWYSIKGVDGAIINICFTIKYTK